MKLFSNINQLHTELLNRTYFHGKYLYFRTNDRKPRDIHKASVKDRLVHRFLYDTLYNYFDEKFIYDSYSCRRNKGVHKAILKFKSFSQKTSKNFYKQVWVLKCDVKKCFASVNQKILIKILNKYIEDQEILSLIENIILSFEKGIPLGNLTSQLFINIYLHELDDFVKKQMKHKWYIRYADDFVIFGNSSEELEILLQQIRNFLANELELQIHEQTNIKTIYSGVSFLGWKHFPHHRVLRDSTKDRAIIGLQSSDENVTKAYMGLLRWGNTYKIKKQFMSPDNFGIL